MDELPQYCTAGVLVLGCGNPLVGDDGFGPAVAERLLKEGVGGRVSGVGDGRMGDGDRESGIGPGTNSSVAVPTPYTRHPTPSVCVINAGTGSRTILFNLVTGEPRPKGIIIVDALDAGKRPGELFEARLESLSLEKAEDFNVHMTPASNMLLKLRDMGVIIRILACQPAPLPGKILPGLSKEVEAAVGPAAEMVMRMAKDILHSR
jgi:coenzyme F420 hydrogenase subunit delta